MELLKKTGHQRAMLWIYAFNLTLVYIFSGAFGIKHLSIPPDNYSLLWLPSGIGLVLFLICGYSAIIWVMIGSFVINNFFSFFSHGHPPTMISIFWGIGFAVIDMLESFLAWKIVQLLEKKSPFQYFTRNAHLISFFVLICIFPSVLTGIGLVSLHMAKAGKLFSFSVILKLVTYYTVGNAIGLLLVTPLFWALKIKNYFSKEKRKEAICVLFVIAGIILFSFFYIPSSLFLIIPVLAILAHYGNLFYSILGAFIICISLSLGTANGYGFFAIHMDNDTMFETELFLLSLAFVLLFSTIAFAELNLHKNKLQMLVDESINTLEISEQRYRVLAENVMDVIWVLNLKLNRFTYISPSIFQIAGVTSEEAILKKLEDFLTPESMKLANERIAISTFDFLNNPNEP